MGGERGFELARSSPGQTSSGRVVLINYGYEITITVATPTPIICLLDIHSERRGDIQKEIFVPNVSRLGAWMPGTW